MCCLTQTLTSSHKLTQPQVIPCDAERVRERQPPCSVCQQNVGFDDCLSLAKLLEGDSSASIVQTQSAGLVLN
jgi:hypothetical protein